MTPRIRTLALSLIGAFALVAAGCGGAAKPGAAASSGAALVRAGALAFASVDSDLGSSQWSQLDTLSKKFPGRATLLSRVKQGLVGQGVDYNSDVKPALGPEVDVAVVSGQTPGQTSFALMTQPKDAGKFKDLVKKLNAHDTSGKPAVYREVKGWYVVSNSQSAIDQVLTSGGSALSDDGTFKDALGKLPSDALVKAYVGGPGLAALIKQAQQRGTTYGLGAAGLGRFDFISASLSAESDGLRLRGAVKSSSGSLGKNYSSKLIKSVPGDALAFFSFPGTGVTGQVRNIQSNPGFRQAGVQMQRLLGVSLQNVIALFGNEVAFYVRPGAVIPEFTLVLSPTSQSAALETLNKLAAKVAALRGAKATGGGKTLNFGRFSVRYGGAHGKVVVTSSVKGISDFGGPGEKLPASADFKEAKAAAGMPGSNAGFLYLDVKNSIGLVESFSALGGTSLPPRVTDNLRPLRSLLAWGSLSGSTGTFDAFLEIK
ncbi:MAG: DUF3352 domain-containing protein [Gaiellaceae bacterium]